MEIFILLSLLSSPLQLADHKELAIIYLKVNTSRNKVTKVAEVDVSPNFVYVWSNNNRWECGKCTKQVAFIVQ